MANKILSISIAAYNVENCLKVVMESIVKAKSIDKIEVLIVNDGSKDCTGELGILYQERYPNSVKLINKTNGGHGSTINTGIEIASGKYYRSVDGDDWVNTDNLDRLVETLEKSDVDAVLCDYTECIGERNLEMDDFKALRNHGVNTLEDVITKVNWMCYHSLIFRTSILRDNSIRIQENCFYVDNEYAIYPLAFVRSIEYFGYPVYCYKIGAEEQSISASSRMKHIEDSRIVSENVLNYYVLHKENISDELSSYLKWNVARICGWHFCSLLYFSPSLSKRDELEKFDRYVMETEPEIFNEMLRYFKETKSPYYMPMKWIRKSNYKFYNMYGKLRKMLKKILK